MAKERINKIIVDQFKKDNNFPSAQFILNSTIMADEIVKQFNLDKEKSNG